MVLSHQVANYPGIELASGRQISQNHAFAQAGTSQ